MTSRGFKPWLLGAFFSFMALSANTAQYPDEAHATHEVVIVRVQWGTPAEVDKICAGINGEKPEGKIYACYHRYSRTIYAPQPRSFNDWWRLAILGHEFWHALGAEHPAD